MNTKQLLCLLGLALVGTSSFAIKLDRENGDNYHGVENIKFGNTATKYGVNMGSFKVSENSDPTNTAFWVYCMDPLTSTDWSQSYTKSNSTNLSNFSTPYNNMFGTSDYQDSALKNGGSGNAGYKQQTNASVNARLLDLYSHAYADATTATGSGSNYKSAAFQYAIWEILGDSTLSSSSGGLKTISDYSCSWGWCTGSNTDAGFTSQVNKYLDALNGTAGKTWADIGLGTVTNYNYTLYAGNPGSQNLLRVEPRNGGNEVPEPGSLALAGLALFGMVYTRRQAKSKR